MAYRHFKPEKYPDSDSLPKALPLSWRESIPDYHRPEDRCSSLGGRLLLYDLLIHFGCDPADYSFGFSKRNKPILIGPKLFFFNISHSYGLAVCVLSDTVEVGVDVEEIRPIDFSAFRKLLRPEEWKEVEKSENPETAFFRHWTAREALAKADGRGLYLAFGSLQYEGGVAELDDRVFQIEPLSLLPDFALCVAYASLERINIEVPSLRSSDYI